MSRSTFKRPAWWGGWTGQRRHENGFRMNAMDILLAAASIFACIALQMATVPLWWTPAYLFATFFVFCNVLRITRRYEIIWCGSFSVSVLVSLALNPSEAPLIIPAVGTALQMGLGAFAWHSGDLKGFRAR